MASYPCHFAACAYVPRKGVRRASLHAQSQRNWYKPVEHALESPLTPSMGMIFQSDAVSHS